MLKPFVLIAGFVLASTLPVAAQKLQLSAEGGLQQSWIPDYTARAVVPVLPPGYGSSIYMVDVATTYHEKPGGYLRGNLSYAISDRVQLYHNLNLQLLRFQPRTEVQNMRGSQEPEEEMGGITYIYDENARKTSLLYLSQELGARYRMLPKIWLHTGLDVSHRLYSQVYFQQLQLGPRDAQGQTTWYSVSSGKDKSGAGFNGMLLGAHLGATYDLCSQFSLSLGLQHSLTPLYEANDATSRRAKANVLRLGVQYKLKSW